MEYNCRNSLKMSASASSKLTGSDKAQHTSRLAQVNIFKTCLSVAVLFMVCWITWEVALLLYIVDVYSSFTGTHYTTGGMLVLLNSGLNPYIYTLRYHEFQRQLRVLLGIKKEPISRAFDDPKPTSPVFSDA